MTTTEFVVGVLSVVLGLAIFAYACHAAGYVRGYVQGCKETGARVARDGRGRRAP